MLVQLDVGEDVDTEIEFEVVSYIWYEDFADIGIDVCWILWYLFNVYFWQVPTLKAFIDLMFIFGKFQL